MCCSCFWVKKSYRLLCNYFSILDCMNVMYFLNVFKQSSSIFKYCDVNSCWFENPYVTFMPSFMPSVYSLFSMPTFAIWDSWAFISSKPKQRFQLAYHMRVYWPSSWLFTSTLLPVRCTELHQCIALHHMRLFCVCIPKQTYEFLLISPIPERRMTCFQNNRILVLQMYPFGV